VHHCSIALIQLVLPALTLRLVLLPHNHVSRPYGCLFGRFGNIIQLLVDAGKEVDCILLASIICEVMVIKIDHGSVTEDPEVSDAIFGLLTAVLDDGGGLGDKRLNVVIDVLGSVDIMSASIHNASTNVITYGSGVNSLATSWPSSNQA
jgi:hypothetical protein